MVTTSITTESILAYQAYLHSEERSASTIENYLRHVRAFAAWLGDHSIDKNSVSEWKQSLLSRDYAPTTINAMLAALHSYFRFRGWAHLRVRYLRVQRRLFRADERALSREEYRQLLRTARAHRMHQLALIIETLGGTGIRVSELCAITVEAAQNKRADIHLKGKIRTILIPSKLSKKLTSYARAQKITRGEIFLTAGGTSISRYKIWADMKNSPSSAASHQVKSFRTICGISSPSFSTKNATTSLASPIYSAIRTSKPHASISSSQAASAADSSNACSSSSERQHH